MTKMWLIVVLMALTSPQPNTPAYVPFVYFENLQQCREYVLAYKDLLFTQSVKKYQGIYFPERAVCVDQDMFRKMFFGKDPRIIEEDL